jgi:hypothetical protein
MNMAKQETMDTIEKTLDTVEYQLDTLERIPKVNLNGTTKQQQIVILSTVAGVSAITGALLVYAALRSRLRQKKIILTPVPDASEASGN